MLAALGNRIISRLDRLSARTVFLIWMSVALFSGIRASLQGHYDNYLIYKSSLVHFQHSQNLYAHYGNFDLFLYGPPFTLLIAPFAIFPDQVACVLWSLFNALALYLAIRQLPLQHWQKQAVLLLSLNELLVSLDYMQVNPLIAALIIFAFAFINEEKEGWAGLMIAVGTLVKLYGIVGFAFFFFSRHKFRLLGSFFFWTIVLLILPVLFGSPAFLVQSYGDWYRVLQEKNALNEGFNSWQDISVYGMIRRIFHLNHLSNLVVVIPALLLFSTAYLRATLFRFPLYRMLVLSSTLIFVVIFSTSSESQTYIIAFTGVAVWFVMMAPEVNRLRLFLFLLAVVLTSLGVTDLVPRFIKFHFVFKYSLKALPCFLIWLAIVYEMLFTPASRFGRKNLPIPG